MALKSILVLGFLIAFWTSTPAHAEDWVYFHDPAVSDVHVVDMDTLEAIRSHGGVFRELTLTRWVLLDSWDSESYHAWRIETRVMCEGSDPVLKRDQRMDLFVGETLRFSGEIERRNLQNDGDRVSRFPGNVLRQIASAACGGADTNRLVHLPFNPLSLFLHYGSPTIDLRNAMGSLGAAAAACLIEPDWTTQERANVITSLIVSARLREQVSSHLGSTLSAEVDDAMLGRCLSNAWDGIDVPFVPRASAGR